MDSKQNESKYQFHIKHSLPYHTMFRVPLIIMLM